MHDTALHIGTLAMNIYADLRTAAVLEVGSLAVNGSLRESALPTTKYVGVDLEEGDGVDVVVETGKPLPLDDDSFDLVMATSVFEHDPCFWMTFLEMCRTAKDGGYIYINAPSNGVVHRYPQDNWRFYPDSGKALAQWAISQGQPVTLVESFIANRETDVWNDFVAVFRKGRITKALPKVFLHEHVPCTNVITWKSKEIINPADATEDMLLLNEAVQRAQQAESSLAEAARERDALADESVQLIARLAQAEEQSRAERVEREALQEQLAEAEQVRSELKLRESELRQRQEEIEQTRSELAQIRSDRDSIGARLLGLEQKFDVEAALRGEAEQVLAQWKELYEREQARAAELLSAQEQLSRERAGLERRLKAAETEVERLEERLRKELCKLEVELEDARAAAQANEAKLSERYQELATLANLLRQQEHRNEETLEHLQWLAALLERTRTHPRWWNLMPRSWRREREHRRLRRTGLFDGSAYLERYPDVAAAGLDPLDHYVRHGIQEGRSRTS